MYYAQMHYEKVISMKSQYSLLLYMFYQCCIFNTRTLIFHQWFAICVLNYSFIESLFIIVHTVGTFHFALISLAFFLYYKHLTMSKKW